MIEGNPWSLKMQAQLTHEEMGLNVVRLDYIRSEGLHDGAQLGHCPCVEATTLLDYKNLEASLLGRNHERIRLADAALECDDGQCNARQSLARLTGTGGELDEVLRGTTDRLRLD